VNIAFSAEARNRLAGHGLSSVPAVCLGDDCVPGGDLEAIASLLSLEYTPPAMLTPSQLFERFMFVLDAAGRYFRQAPFEGLAVKSPDRDRSFRELAMHITLIPKAFVTAYDTDEFPRTLFQEENVDPGLSGDDPAGILAQSQATLRAWWETSGQEDPMDRVLETYWGAHTLHEAFERETWHSAQHTRQVIMFLSMLGIAADRPLTAEDLAGLPLPEGVWD
jgi:hypothetical protein